MVHHWIHLRNDKVTEPCLNQRVTRIFQNRGASFYGDYDLDIYIGTKHDYGSLEAVIEKVLRDGSGWIRNVKMRDAIALEARYLSRLMSDCGWFEDAAFKKMVPWKEDGRLLHTLVLRKDGNFIFYGCETARFYYVICFATS
jgi:hypothetical protein